MINDNANSERLTERRLGMIMNGIIMALTEGFGLSASVCAVDSTISVFASKGNSSGIYGRL